jgi:hypothetical protein
MEETIIALLNNNLRVIIPDFGAFIIRQKQPRIIVFNEFLRYNDGILIDFIVKTEGIDRDIAEQRVLDFAEDGTKLLSSGRELVIEGLGSLRKDSSGKINFIESPEITEVDKKSTQVSEIITEEEEKKSIPPAKSAAAKKNKTKKPVSKVKPATEPIAIEPAIEPAVIEPAIEPAIEPSAIEPAIDPTTEPVAITAESTGPVAANPEPVSIVNLVVEIPPVRKPPLAEKADTNAERPAPMATNNILAWILLILFVNLIILAWFVFRKKTNEKPAGKAETAFVSDSLNEQLADSVRAAAMDSDIVYNDVPENEGSPIVNSQTPGSRYYIVAGCFRDEVNADSLVASLKHLGFKAEKFGKIGNLYAVCFASFDDKEKAVPELKKIREKIPSAWMTKF